MYSYEQMLEQAYQTLEKLRVGKSFTDRFEVPFAKISYQKNWTILINSREIANILNREVSHLAKFLQVEFNAPTKLEDNIIIIQKKVTQDQVNEKIRKYVKEFVICPVCGKPDTKLTKINRIYYLKCEACGAESPVLYKIK